jgi:gluconate 2-dehydrogenase gamma chain
MLGGMPSDRICEALSSDAVETLTAVVDRLIPDDAAGPGAVRAGVVDYIVGALGREHGRHRRTYEIGLRTLDERARAERGERFIELGTIERDELLRAIDAGGTPATELERFFELVRTHAMEGMFGDPSWGGNRDGAGWELIGYLGPRKEWSYEAQRVEVVATAVERG